jgi:TatD DNase family protein
LVDSHAHLSDPRFDPDRAAVLERARAAGVEPILTVGLGRSAIEFERTLELVEAHDHLWAALGLHPHEAAQASPQLLAELERLCQHPRLLAWGEIGLDYHDDHSPRTVQREVFRQQLRGARSLKLPVVIHCREAWEDCLAILEQDWANTGLGGVLHCFSGTLAQAQRASGWGFLISFAGNITFPRAQELRQVARHLTPDQMLIETDAPYLAPQAFRGKRNEPAYVVEVAAELARLHGCETEEMARVTQANFLRLFPRAQRS